jgi:hypothetical protein
MPDLRESIALNAPAGFALATISTYFSERATHDAVRLALRFPVPAVIISGLTLEKIVSLTLGSGAVDAVSKSIAFDWKPVGTTALPNFSGTIVARPQTDETAMLEIDGTYVAPGGVFGALFDRLVGVHIARTTLRTLLDTFARTIETDYDIRSRF